MSRMFGFLTVLFCGVLLGGPMVTGALAAERIVPVQNMAVPEGAELTGPCQSMPWPWNAMPDAPGESVYSEEDRLTLFIHDVNHDGWQYDDPAFAGQPIDDKIIYAIGPPADDEAAEWQQPYDTDTCWRWDWESHSSNWVVPRTEGWSGYGLPDAFDPTQHDPLMADRQGNWRMQVWRTWRHWYKWDPDETGCLGTTSAPWSDCWDPNYHPEHGYDNAGSVLERTVDFTVSDPAVIILSGPSGTVGAPAATFDFVWPGEEEGHYECRLVEQGASWSTCEAPVTYGDLADGQHEFNVRFVLQGQDPEDAHITMHPWRVDTTPPRASITDTPAGQTSASSSLIKFVSNEPEGATFRCRVDDGPKVDCSSPHRVAGLELGHHVFEVKAIDAVGNEQPDWTSSRWEVVPADPGVPGGGGGGAGGAAGPSLVHPPPPASSSCDPVKVAPIVVVGREGTCAKTTRQGAVDVHTWHGPVTINGLPLRPKAGGSFQLKVKTDVVVAELRGNGTLNLNIVDLGVGAFKHEVKRSIGKAQWKFQLLPGGSNVAAEASKAAMSFAGLKMSHLPTFELDPSDGGSGRFTMVLDLPEIFRGVKDGKSSTDKNGGLTFEYGFTSSNTKGLKWLGKGSVKKAFVFGKVTLDDLSLSLAGPPLTFEGSGKLVLARGVANHADPGVALAVGLGGQNGPFTDVNKFEIQATNIQKPLGSGVFFQRLGGKFTRCSITGGGTGAKLSANAGLSFGPRLKLDKVWEGELISADGTVALDLCKDLVELSGAAKIVEIPVGELNVKHKFGVITEFDATAHFSLGLAGARVSGEGWATTSAANFEGTGQLQLLGDERRGDVIISSRGVAGCYTALGLQVGFRKPWGKSVEKVTNSCSVGPMKVAKPAGASAVGGELGASLSGAASASASTVKVRVAAKQPLHVFVARGGNAPPAVIVRGPGGRTYSVPPGEAPVEMKDALVLRDPETATTYVIVRAPAAGVWRVTPHPEQAAGFKVLSAEGLPKPRVKAKIKGKAGKRTLSWQLTQLPGQKVTFIERAGGVAKVIAKTGAARGERRFKPAPGRGGKREIEALIEQGGMPRAKLIVARYQAPASRRTKRVKGLTRSLPLAKRAKRKRQVKPRPGRVLRWQPQAAAGEYSLVVRRADGRTIVATPKVAKVRLPAATARERLKVTILAIDQLGHPGPTTTFTLS